MKAYHAKYFNSKKRIRNLKSKAVKGAGTMLFSRVLINGLQIVSIIILARLLTPDDFGLVTMVTSFSFFLFNVGLNGFTEVIIQREELSHEQVSTLFWIGVGLSGILALLFSLSAPLFNLFYGETRLVPIVVVFSMGFLMSGLATQHQALLNRNFEFKKVLSIDVLAVVVSVVVAIVMAMNGLGYWSIVARQMTIPFITVLLAWTFCSWRPGMPKWTPEIKSMLIYASQTFGSFSMRYFSRNIDKILIGWYWGSKLLGSYDRAYHLFILPVNQITSPLTRVALATLSRLVQEPEMYKRYYVKALSLLTFIGMMASLILTVSGREIIVLLLGPNWSATGDIFSALSPAIGMTLILGTFGWLHLSQGRAERNLKWTTFSLLVTTLFLFIGLPFGATGVAIAYSASFYILMIPGIWYAGKPMQIGLFDVLGGIWQYMVSALLSGLLVWYLSEMGEFLLTGFESENILLKIIFKSSICLGLYLALIVLFFRSLSPLFQIYFLAKDVMKGKK